MVGGYRTAEKAHNGGWLFRREPPFGRPELGGWRLETRLEQLSQLHQCNNTLGGPNQSLRRIPKDTTEIDVPFSSLLSVALHLITGQLLYIGLMCLWVGGGNQPIAQEGSVVMVLDGPSFQVGELPTCTVHQGVGSANVPRLDLGHMQVGSRIPLHRTSDEIHGK